MVVTLYDSGGDQFKHTSSGGTCLENSFKPRGSNFEDGGMNEDSQNYHNEMDFTSRLQQFKQIQHQHRIRLKSRAQACYGCTTIPKEVRRPDEQFQLMPVPSMDDRLQDLQVKVLDNYNFRRQDEYLQLVPVSEMDDHLQDLHIQVLNNHNFINYALPLSMVRPRINLH